MGQRHHTHTSCDDATLNCYHYFISHTAKKYGREVLRSGNRGVGEGNDGNENGNGLARKGKDRRDRFGLPPCRPTVLLMRSAGRKKWTNLAGRGEVDWDHFPFPFVLPLGVFLCIRSFFFLLLLRLAWTLFFEKAP